MLFPTPKLCEIKTENLGFHISSSPKIFRFGGQHRELLWLIYKWLPHDPYLLYFFLVSGSVKISNSSHWFIPSLAQSSWWECTAGRGSFTFGLVVGFWPNWYELEKSKTYYWMELCLPYCSIFLISIQMALDWKERQGREAEGERGGWEGKKENKREREGKQINKIKALNKHLLAA